MSCAGACVVPAAAGVANALGFSGPGVSSCCKLPCPTLPIHNITICVRINAETCLKIQQGCAQSDTVACDVDYSWGQTYDSWGRRCRVVTWQRQVPDDAYIRLRFCSCSGACETRCGSDGIVTNALLKFEVDGTNVLHLINEINTQSKNGVAECIRAACINSGNPGDGQWPAIIDPEVDCCYIERFTPNWTISAIPQGAEVVLGPLSDIYFVSPVPKLLI